MVDRSDRHFRAMIRVISRKVLVYTPMITTHAILRGDRERILGFGEAEHPVSLQLGGDDPVALASCARIAEALGYDEINLNVGCPSSRVQGGNFGAILMRQPQRVADACAAMIDAVSIPVTVKHRIGVDELDGYEDMLNFVDIVSQAGVERFTVHARKAWLEGLSPKQNRTIPPLRHGEVARLKRERPHLWIETNGGVISIDQVLAHLDEVDAVMLGRAAWDNPMVLAEVDSRVYGEASEPTTPADAARDFARYAARALSDGCRPVGVLRNALNLFHGHPGNKAFKRAIASLSQRPFDGAPAFLRAFDAAIAAQQATQVRMRDASEARTPVVST